MTVYICSSCGGGSVEVNEAQPSLDDRYPLGHCVRCTPWPKPKENPLKKGDFIQPPRKSVALVRADLFDRAAFDHQQKVEAARRLANKLHSGKGARMSDEELKAASEAAAWLRREGP